MTSVSITITDRGEIYDVHLARDGDHIVTKHDPRNDWNSYVVSSQGRTWRRAVDKAADLHWSYSRV